MRFEEREGFARPEFVRFTQLPAHAFLDIEIFVLEERLDERQDDSA